MEKLLVLKPARHKSNPLTGYHYAGMSVSQFLNNSVETDFDYHTIITVKSFIQSKSTAGDLVDLIPSL